MEINYVAGFFKYTYIMIMKMFWATRDLMSFNKFIKHYPKSYYKHLYSVVLKIHILIFLRNGTKFH